MSCKNPSYWCWDRKSCANNFNSLLDFIEINDEKYKNKYLDFVYYIGKKKINDMSLERKLVLNHKFSFWWMNIIVEQSVWKTPINDVLKIFALEDIIKDNNINIIEYKGKSLYLYQTLLHLCKLKKIHFDSIYALSIRSLLIKKYKIYYQLKSILHLFLIFFKRFHFIKQKPYKIKLPNNSLFFCSYLFNYNVTEANNGKHNSPYWGDLPKLLRKIGLKSFWLNLYVPTREGAKAKKCQEWIDSFNSNEDNQESHFVLNNYINTLVILRTFYFWLVLQFKISRIKNIQEIFVPKNCNLTFWYILKDNWMDSVHGSCSISSILTIEQFDQVMRHVPRQKLGYYIWENQNWEKALIYFWNKYNHGTLHAVTPAPVRYWDLRFSFNKNVFLNAKYETYPTPQKYIAIGNQSKNILLINNVPHERIVEGEALRFGHLNNNCNIKLRNKYNNLLRVLLLGDYILSDTDYMINLVSDIITIKNYNLDVAIKPHPNTPINTSIYHKIDLSIESRPFNTFGNSYDICIASNKTSSAIDAYFHGINVAVLQSDDSLNLSPLRAQEGVLFFQNVDELYEILLDKSKNHNKIPENNDYLFLDSSLKRWRKLINVTAKNLI